MDLAQSIAELARQLEARRTGDPDFRVEMETGNPLVQRLLDGINAIGRDWADFHDKESNLAAQALNALQTRNEEMHRDLDTARKIQLRMLPPEAELPDRQEIDAAGFYQSMDMVGGDIYDIIRVGRNAYGLLMADVSGHGIPSALITALVKVAFRTKARWGVAPSVMVNEVNAELYPILADLDYFVTAFFAILNLEDGHLGYVNCGHHPALLHRPGRDLTELAGRGRFLGPFEDLALSDHYLDLEPGDCLFMYTDGIIESRSFLDEEYGLDRLMGNLEASAGHHAAHGGRLPRLLVDNVRKDLDFFLSGAPVHDDLSMLALQFLCRAEPWTGPKGAGSGR